MINICPLKYLSLSNVDGPIKYFKVEQSKINFETFGFNSFVYLKDELRYKFNDNLKLYGTCDGHGISPNKNTSILKAFSESLERWAFYYNRAYSNSDYLFDYDFSTNGMSAMAEIYPHVVRKISLNEALERWCIVEFCEGNIGTVEIENSNFSILQFKVDYQNIKVVLLYKMTEFGQVYGFSAHNNLKKAIQSAECELFRNFNIIKDFSLNRHKPEIESIIEQRLLHFSRNEGVDNFFRLKQESLKLNLKIPELILDKKIVGPWSKYTTVWRCLFRYSSLDFLDKSLMKFYF